MKNKLIGIVAVLIIIVSVSFIFKQFSSISQYTYDRIMVDVQANKVFVGKLPVDKVILFPVESPYSAGQNAYPAAKCVNCGKIFGFIEPSVSAEIPGQTGIKCPYCGSADEPDIPSIPGGEKVMDVEGPVQVAKPGQGAQQ